MNAVTNDGAVDGLNLENASNLFGRRLREARKRKGMTQSVLGKNVFLSRMVIANWEKGNSSPDPDQAIHLAKILEEDPAVYLLLSALQKAATNSALDEEVVRVVDDLLRKYEKVSVPRLSTPTLKTHISLMDFPEAFLPITVIVGDKREEEPQNAGDLFVFSATTVDDRWLPSVGLRQDTEKISDKVLMTSRRDPEWLKKKLGKRHIMCIGSPASNLFAREYNNRFMFRFAISREATSKWEEKRSEMERLNTPEHLALFYHQNKPDLKQIMRLFKPPGFIDFNYKHLRLGVDVGYSMDFAVISLGLNPFAEPGEPFFAVLVAGIHHPGTANAVKFLANPGNFEKHPFGGVLEVQVPSKHFPPNEISWHNKIENCFIDWHHVGEGHDPLAYTPESLLDQLQNHWLEKFRKDDVITDVPIDEEEINRHIHLINLLAKAREEIRY